MVHTAPLLPAAATLKADWMMQGVMVQQYRHLSCKPRTPVQQESLQQTQQTAQQHSLQNQAQQGQQVSYVRLIQHQQFLQATYCRWPLLLPLVVLLLGQQMSLQTTPLTRTK
jgi:hypothetical protein